MRRCEVRVFASDTPGERDGTEFASYFAYSCRAVESRGRENPFSGGETNMARFHRLVGLLVLATGCGAPVDSAELDELEATGSEPLIGAVNQIDNHPFSAAVARINFLSPAGAAAGSCTGTLVAPNKVITAAHCFCGSIGGGTLQFADATGNIPGTAPTFAFNQWQIPPDVQLCGGVDWVNDTARDIAVITLQAPFPTATPAQVFLGHPEIAVETGRLNQTWWSIGYGNNTPIGLVPGRCVGCNVRRSGAWNQVGPERDACTSFIIPFEFDCWNGVLWSAKSIEDGNSMEASNGDSGGPLFFNVDSALPPVVSGAFSHGDGFSRWSTFGENADFLWGAIGLPFTLTLAEQRAGTAVYAKRSLRINDRAHVQFGVSANAGARVVAGAGTTNAGVRIGVEAFVGDVRARGTIFLEDRSRVGAVFSKDRIHRRNGVIASVPPLAAEFQRFEDFDIASPFVPFNTTTNVGPGASTSMAPGVHGNTTVFGNSTLTLGAGLHIFNRLQLESGSQLALGAGPVWVFVNAGGSLIFRGQVTGNAANHLIAAPNASSIFIGNNFQGTLVAPRASVTADMVTNALLAGAFFVNDFELHQGRFLQFVPFTRNWIPTCLGGGFTGCN
jgi:hypothetical protein